MHACERARVHVFVQAFVHLHRLSGLAQWAGVELHGSPSRPVLCQALPRSAACQWVGGCGEGAAPAPWPPGPQHTVSNSNCQVHTHAHALTHRMYFNSAGTRTVAERALVDMQRSVRRKQLATLD